MAQLNQGDQGDTGGAKVGDGFDGYMRHAPNVLQSLPDSLDVGKHAGRLHTRVSVTHVRTCYSVRGSCSFSHKDAVLHANTSHTCPLPPDNNTCSGNALTPHPLRSHTHGRSQTSQLLLKRSVLLSTEATMMLPWTESHGCLQFVPIVASAVILALRAPSESFVRNSITFETSKFQNSKVQRVERCRASTAVTVNAMRLPPPVLVIDIRVNSRGPGSPGQFS
eukprot:758312-Hanusia_phi.AAC.1